MRTLYLGPSWAVQSFDPPQGNDNVTTNLAQELNLMSCVDLARCGDSNMSQLKMAQEFLAAEPGPARAIFITANSLQDSEELLGIDRVDFAKHFLAHNDSAAVIKDLERSFYQKLCELEIPVALIGAHTDVFDYKWPSYITVIHDSWQKFLLTQANIVANNFFGWPAEVAHRWLQGQIDSKQGSIVELAQDRSPSADVVFQTHKTLRLWQRLQQNRLWYEVHPNRRGNVLFAAEIKNSMQQWLDNTN